MGRVFSVLPPGQPDRLTAGLLSELMGRPSGKLFGHQSAELLSALSPKECGELLSRLLPGLHGSMRRLREMASWGIPIHLNPARDGWRLPREPLDPLPLDLSPSPVHSSLLLSSI